VIKIKIIKILFISLIFFIFSNLSYADYSFESFKKKKVSYLDFFLLKTENNLFRRANIMRRQALPTRVQYSNISTTVEYDKKNDRINIDIYTIMDKTRYSKKKYVQKVKDCNQVRNLIFYNRTGYSFIKQKRKPDFSEGIMKEIFKEVFFSDFSFNEKEIEFLLNKMFVKVTILHPVYKKELTCLGKINDYELK